MSSRDSPTVAEAIVVHAGTVCEHEDHLWDVIRDVSIPVDLLTDYRDEHKVDHGTEPMVRAFLYKEIRGFSQNELANRLANRPILVKRFGLEKAPSQQTINHIWNNFSKGTQEILKAAAIGIRDTAVEQDDLAEALVPISPDDDDAEDDRSARAYKRERSSKAIKLARKHAFPEFETGRASNLQYSDEAILDMFARICAHRGSAHSEGQYGWLSDDDLTCHESTFLRTLKKFATPDWCDAQLTSDEFLDDDRMPKIERIQDSVVMYFDAAIENIINSVRGDRPFKDRWTIAAIDITPVEFYAEPWLDKEAGIPNPDYPRMSSGYVEKKEYKRGYKFATITLVGGNVPIIFAIEPVKENSAWEEEDAPSYSKAGIVERLLDKAQKFVDIDEVLFDRGFYSIDVFAAVENRDIVYTAPVPKYVDDYKNIDDIREHPAADAAVKHNERFYHEGQFHHWAEFMYVPSRNEEADGKYAVFVTNRTRVEPDEIQKVCNGYRRRWDIENQYKSIKDFLPRTSSTDYRIRFTNFALSALIYNLWRLTDYLIKVALDMDIRAPPVVTVKTFVRAMGKFLREFD